MAAPASEMATGEHVAFNSSDEDASWLTPTFIAHMTPYVRSLLVLTRVFCDAVRQVDISIKAETEFLAERERNLTSPFYARHQSTLGNVLDYADKYAVVVETLAKMRDSKELYVQILTALQLAKDNFVFVDHMCPEVYELYGHLCASYLKTRKHGDLKLYLFSKMWILESTGAEMNFATALYRSNVFRLADTEYEPRIKQAMLDLTRGQEIMRDIERNPKAFLLQTVGHF
jgi:hypothetical protein